MRSLAWLTDIHLNFLGDPELDAFARTVDRSGAKVVVISGDIAEARSVGRHLQRMAHRVRQPIYFVLGNHDYYHGSIPAVREQIGTMTAKHPTLHWLPAVGVVELGAGAALVGHGGWGDGRLGDYAGSTVMLNDYLFIRELAGLSSDRRLARLNHYGDEAAAYVSETVAAAAAEYARIVFVTHVPPFRDACWHEGSVSTDDWLPHFTCKAVGDALVDVMNRHPACRLTVLCGHTHSGGTVDIRENLRVVTGGAEYRAPALQPPVDYL